MMMSLGDLIAWLLEPIRMTAVEPVNATDRLHALLMTVAVGVALPLMVVITRYWKVMPDQDWPRVLDHPLWWRVHVVVGVGSIAAVIVATALAFHGMSIQAHLQSGHGWVGWLAVAMTLAIGVNGLLRGTSGGPGVSRHGTLDHLHDRPGDHYDMTARRRWFERTHKTLGYWLMVVFWIALVSGLWQANAPRYALLALAGWWTLLLLLAWRWERQGRVFDGYQAKWGPSMNHPGNRIPVLGWGSRRYTEERFARRSWRRRRSSTARRPRDAVAATGRDKRPAAS